MDHDVVFCPNESFRHGVHSIDADPSLKLVRLHSDNRERLIRDFCFIQKCNPPVAIQYLHVNNWNLALAIEHHKRGG